MKQFKSLAGTAIAVMMCLTMTAWAQTGTPDTDNSIAIDAANFPDDNFRNYLLSQPWGADAKLTPAEIAEITDIEVGYMDIADMTGIEYFTALEVLDCAYNYLETLDVSGLSNLQFLSCNNNNLTTLNVSGLSNLESLGCNNNNLTTLDLSGLSKLKIVHAQQNPLNAASLAGLKSISDDLHVLFYTENLVHYLIVKEIGKTLEIRSEGDIAVNGNLPLFPNVFFAYTGNLEALSNPKDRYLGYADAVGLTNVGFTDPFAPDILFAEATADEMSITFYFKGEYGITYHLNGGAFGVPVANSYFYNDDFVLPDTPTKAGYVFAGWYDNAALSGTSVEMIPESNFGAREFWARWEEDDDTPILAAFAPQNLRITLMGNNLHIDGVGALRIYNLKGNIVLSKTITRNETISIAHLPKGVYMVNVAGKTVKVVR